MQYLNLYLVGHEVEEKGRTCRIVEGGKMCTCMIIGFRILNAGIQHPFSAKAIKPSFGH